MANSKFILLMLFGWGPLTVFAQEWKEKIFQAGFEQVHVLQKKDSVTVFFEHRLFRNPFHSFQFAQKLLEGEEERVITWVPLYNNKPVAAYIGKQLQFRRITEEESGYFKRNNNLLEGYRFHFRIMPDFHGRFGRFDKPLETKTHIILDAKVYLLPGLSLQSGVLFPIQNSLDNRDEGIRLAPTHLHYFNHWKSTFFLSLTAGTFYSDRYGLDFQFRFAPLDSRWSVGFEAGYTGFYYFEKGVVYSQPLSDKLLIGDVEYRLPIADLSVKLSAGQFLFEDKGARAEVIRQFGAVDVGLYLSRTEIGSTAGFQFAFPLFPGKIFRTNKVEVRTTEEFRWEYSYSNRPVARKYRLGTPRLSDQLRQYNFLFLQDQLD